MYERDDWSRLTFDRLLEGVMSVSYPYTHFITLFHLEWEKLGFINIDIVVLMYNKITTR